MSEELADDDPRKWGYSEHSRAKHRIQNTYLGAWLPILGSRNPTLLLFDGFAGRGRYTGGEPGSPLLFWQRATEAVDAGRARSVRIRCVELNSNNHASLSAEIADLRHERVKITAVQGAFAEQADLAADIVLKYRPRPPPTFWTADPYGFKGVPLEIVRKLMSIPRSEMLITFMVRDMRRFLGQDNFEAPLTEFFGSEVWRRCIQHSDAVRREECLLLRYSEVVRDDIAQFATPFRVFEDERRQTLYYLVHLSNHPLGMREMKDAMVRESSDMTFWPVTLRPPDQLELDTGEQPPWPRLQAHLAEAYGGKSMSFEGLLNTDYATGLWITRQYRDAVLALEAAGRVTIRRDRDTPSGRAPQGLKSDDVIIFPMAQMTMA